MITQSAARNLMILMVDSADHVTGKTGLTLTLTLSKDGGAFASISPTVTERGSGWYSVALTSSHTDTAGDLVLHATGTGADPTDVRDEVSAALATAAQATAIETDTQDLQSRLPAALVSGRIDASVGAMAAGVVTAAAIAANAIDADALATDAVTEIQTGLATSSALADVQADVDAVAAGVAALPSAATTASAVAALTKDGLTLLEHQGVQSAMLAGLVTGGPANSTFRAVDDSADRVQITADEDGNRSSVTITP